MFICEYGNNKIHKFSTRGSAYCTDSEILRKPLQPLKSKSELEKSKGTLLFGTLPRNKNNNKLDMLCTR